MKPSSIKESQVMQGVFIKAAEDQLKNNDPPETAETMERLLSEGISKRDALSMIAWCIANEMTAVIESDEPFDKDRFVKQLNTLPAAWGR